MQLHLGQSAELPSYLNLKRNSAGGIPIIVQRDASSCFLVIVNEVSVKCRYAESALLTM